MNSEIPANLTPAEAARLKAVDDDNCLWHRELERIRIERRFASPRSPSQRFHADVLKRRALRMVA